MIIFDDNAFEFMSCGYFNSKGIWTHSYRCIDSIEIIFITQGTVYIEQGGMQYVLNKGDMLILKQGILHGGYRPSEQSVMFYWLHFTVDDFDKLGVKNLYIEGINEQRVTMAFQNLLHVANSGSYNKTTWDICALMIVEEILSHQSIYSKNSKLIFSQIKEFVRNNINLKISVMDTANKFGYNEEYVSHIFKKEYGIGLKQYINNERINAVKNTITSTNHSIKEIAYIYHFNGLNEFVKYFKYHTGTTPSQYRGSFWHTHINIV